MIINIFSNLDEIKKDNLQNKNGIKNIEDKKILKKYNNICIKQLQKFAIENGIEYLKKGLKEPIIKMLEEYITFNYNENNIEIINLAIKKVLDNMFGYGILQKYILSENISDIRVVKYNLIYIKKLGKWEKVDDSFESEEEFLEYIRYCIIKNNSNINFDTPIVIVSDKKYNLRLEAGINPINSISPSLVIRIHRNNNNTLKLLYNKEKMLDKNSYNIIKNAVNAESNIIISGKGGSGKTALLKAIINEIPNQKAITVNEETSELFIENKNIIQREILENRNENKNIDLEKLMKHSMVMSNDVIVVGEIKGKEMTTFLDAITTGHIGLATVHSNSAFNTINRLITLFKRDIKAQQYKDEFIKYILSSSIDYIIYMNEYKVCQIVKYEYDKNIKKYKLNLLYERK